MPSQQWRCKMSKHYLGCCIYPFEWLLSNKLSKFYPMNTKLVHVLSVRYLFLDLSFVSSDSSGLQSLCRSLLYLLCLFMKKKLTCLLPTVTLTSLPLKLVVIFWKDQTHHPPVMGSDCLDLQKQKLKLNKLVFWCMNLLYIVVVTSLHCSRFRFFSFMIRKHDGC